MILRVWKHTHTEKSTGQAESALQRDQFGYRRGNFPVTEYPGDVSWALPFAGVMTEDQVDYVCRQLRTAVTP